MATSVWSLVAKPVAATSPVFALPRAPKIPSKRLQSHEIPLRTSVMVVIARTSVCLSGLQHVAKQIDGYLDEIASYWTFESASKGGFARLLTRLLARDGVSNRSSDQLVTEQQLDRVIHQVAAAGHVPVLAWWRLELLQHQWSDRQSRLVFEIAAQCGHLPVIQWLHDQNCLWSITDGPSVTCNHQEIVSWLHAQELEFRLSISVDKAIQQSQLEFLQWAVAHNQLGLYELSCTANATVLAATQGDLPALRWLQANHPDYCSEWMLSYAAMQGHLHAVKWLQKQYPAVVFLPPGTHVVRNGHMHVIQWMLTRFHWRSQQSRMTWISEMIASAVDAGQFEMVWCLHHQRMGAAFVLCVGRFVMKPVEWLHNSLWSTESSQAHSLWASLLRFSLLQLCRSVLQAEASVMDAIARRKLTL